MALVDVELKTLVSEPDALTTRPSYILMHNFPTCQIEIRALCNLEEISV